MKQPQLMAVGTKNHTSIWQRDHEEVFMGRVLSEADRANIFMADKLLAMVDDGEITSDYDCKFIRNISAQLHSGISVSVKSIHYLEKCFHFKY